MLKFKNGQKQPHRASSVKPSHLRQHIQKTQNLKFFSLQTRRPAEPFESLNSSLAQSNSELWSCKVA